MDDHDITAFGETLHDAGPFAGRGTHEAAAASTLLHHRHRAAVEPWVAAAITALRDGMREDAQPPVARAILQTPTAVEISEAEPCCHTAWWVDQLADRARALPDVWVALAVPDTWPLGIDGWNPLNVGHDVHVIDMRWFVEIRGRRMGLRNGKLLRTGRTPLDHQVPARSLCEEDPELLRLGRRILRGHPVRRR